VPSAVQEVRLPDAGVPSAGVVSVGEVSVLLVSVSDPANVLNVPVVGKVTLVAAVNVLVKAKLPEPVTVMAALLATPVPPLAGASVPARVTVPEEVIGPPEVVKPVVPPETSTLVTEPAPGPVNATVMAPLPLVMVTPEPAVSVAGVSVLPVVLPISSCPLVKLVWPVPPLATPRVPVMSAVDRLTASQDALVPSLCRYLLAADVCDGSKLLSAAAAVDAPVPPSATARSVMPVMLPPVMVAELDVIGPVTPPGAPTAPVSVEMPVTARVVLAVMAFAARVVLATVSVPVAAPMFTAVAAPARLTVVAVVLTRAKVVDGVVRLVVTAGDVRLVVPVAVSVPATASVLPAPTLSPTLVPVPAAANSASTKSRSVLTLVPQVSVLAPTSGLVSSRFVVVVSAMIYPKVRALASIVPACVDLLSARRKSSMPLVYSATQTGMRSSFCR